MLRHRRVLYTLFASLLTLFFWLDSLDLIRLINDDTTTWWNIFPSSCNQDELRSMEKEYRTCVQKIQFKVSEFWGTDEIILYFKFLIRFHDLPNNAECWSPGWSYIVKLYKAYFPPTNSWLGLRSRQTVTFFSRHQTFCIATSIVQFWISELCTIHLQ